MGFLETLVFVIYTNMPTHQEKHKSNYFLQTCCMQKIEQLHCDVFHRAGMVEKITLYFYIRLTRMSKILTFFCSKAWFTRTSTAS